jgi:hypothetical protein
LPIRQDIANRQAMELDIAVPQGWNFAVQDQTMKVQPRRTASGDVYRLRLSGQERPRFTTDDGTTYEPAILSTHPLISDLRLEQVANTEGFEIVGRGHFLDDVTAWAWPTHDLDQPATELPVTSDDEGFLIQWPANSFADHNSYSSISFVLGRRSSDGLFGDTIDYAKEDSDGMRLHPGWVISAQSSDTGSQLDYDLDSLSDPFTQSFHHHRVLEMVSGKTAADELSDGILQVLCSSTSNFRCSHFSSLDTPHSPIPWQYLADLVPLRDELKPELHIEDRAKTRKPMIDAAERMFDFHEQENIPLPHKVMPLFFARSLGQASSEFVQILGWREQRQFEIVPPGHSYYDWLQALGLTSICFRRELVGAQADAIEKEVTWSTNVGKLMFRDNGKKEVELPGRLEFTPLQDGAVSRIPATLTIANCIHCRIDHANLFDAKSGDRGPVSTDLRQAMRLDFPAIHERVFRTTFPGEQVTDPSGHVSFTRDCVWSLSWAIALALTGSRRYQALLHKAGTNQVMLIVKQQPSAFRVGIALAALAQSVVYDGGLGCAARFQNESVPSQPR